MSTVNFTKEEDGALATFNDGQTISWSVGGVRIEAITDSVFKITGIDGTTTFDLNKNTVKIEGANVTQDASDIVDNLTNNVFDELGGGGDGGTGEGIDMETIGIYLPEDYGADGDGTTDDSAAFQACVDAAPEGATIYLSNKTYKLTSKVTIDKKLHIKGGAFKTSKLITDGDNVLLEVASMDVTIENIVFEATGTRTDGAGIHALHSGDTPAYETTIKNCFFNGLYVGIKHDASFHFVAERNTFYECWHRDMIIENDLQSDIGDQHIINNYFDGGFAHAPAISIEYNSGGGMKLIGNKFNWSGGTGIRYQTLVSVNISETNDFIVTGNSFENFTNRGIEIVTADNFGKITITGNQFSALTAAMADIEITGCHDISIQGNTFSDGGDESIILTECDNVKLCNVYDTAYTTPVTITSCTNVRNFDEGDTYTLEQIQDIVASMFNTDHVGTIVNYDDGAAKLQIEVGGEAPTDLTGAVLILDADDVVVDGSNNVTEWHDQTGLFLKSSDSTENFFVPINGAPVLIDDDLSLGNVVSFDGVDDVLWAIDTGLGNDNTITVAIIMKEGGTNFFTNRINFSGSGAWWSTGQGSSEIGSPYEVLGGLLGDDPMLLVFTISTTEVKVHINGSLVDNSTGTFALGNANAGGGLLLGGYYHTSAFHGFSAVKVAELRVYPTALNDTDREQLEAFLMDKHGIS